MGISTFSDNDKSNVSICATGMIRKPAVAGQFYPADPRTLRSDITRYLAHETPIETPPSILILPHAGYVFSAPVAAKGFASIDRSTTTVIMIGPSHHEAFKGIAVSGFDAWETPLGHVAINHEIADALLKNPIARVIPDADIPEHSLEVQIPFLQMLLSAFTIVPIQTGNVDPAEVAKLLLPFITPHTLVIVSSDLSHFNTDNEAQLIDKMTVDTVLSMNPQGKMDACGERPMRVAMYLASTLGLTPKLLDLRNSYQTLPRPGSEKRVVGYASIAFIGKLVMQTPSDEISAETKTFLLTLARSSLNAAVNEETPPHPLSIPDITKKNSGCFVTLTKNGRLRGCIGYIEPIKPLFQAVMENARNAALQDSRFPLVTPSELRDIHVEISVLTEPVMLEFSTPEDLLAKLKPGEDGIILEQGYNRSTFLPQVWEQLPDKNRFLEALAVKAGMAKDGWKSAKVKRYRAIHFQEA